MGGFCRQGPARLSGAGLQGGFARADARPGQDQAIRGSLPDLRRSDRWRAGGSRHEGARRQRRKGGVRQRQRARHSRRLGGLRRKLSVRLPRRPGPRLYQEAWIARAGRLSSQCRDAERRVRSHAGSLLQGADEAALKELRHQDQDHLHQ